MNTTETISDDFLQPVSALTPSNRQRLFLRYFTAVLVDLVVLNLFVEYWSSVTIDSFTVSLFAAVVLQVLLKSTLALEHRLAAHFKSKQGGFAKFMRYFSAWLVLFGSKFIILGAIDVLFADNVVFAGPLHGLVALIIVLFAMLAAEELIERIYRRLL